MPELVKHFVADGYVQDKFLSDFKFVKYTGDDENLPMEERITMRQRAVLLNGAGWRSWKLKWIQRKATESNYKQERRDLAQVNADAKDKVIEEREYLHKMVTGYADYVQELNGQKLPKSIQLHRKRTETGNITLNKRKGSAAIAVLKPKRKKIKQIQHEAVESCNIKGPYPGTVLGYCSCCKFVNWCNSPACKGASTKHIENCSKHT